MWGADNARATLDLALASESIDDAERIFTEAYEQYGEEEIRWIGRRFGEWWRTHQNRIHMGAEQFDAMVEDDRDEYLDNLAKETPDAVALSKINHSTGI